MPQPQVEVKTRVLDLAKKLSEQLTGKLKDEAEERLIALDGSPDELETIWNKVKKETPQTDKPEDQDAIYAKHLLKELGFEVNISDETEEPIELQEDAA